MNLNMILLHDTTINKEVRNVLALITLELNDLAKLFVVHNIPITTEVLFQTLEDLLVAQILSQTLNCRQAFLPIPLLDSNMNILFGSSATEFFSFSEWIES